MNYPGGTFCGKDLKNLIKEFEAETINERLTHDEWKAAYVQFITKKWG